MAAALGIGLRPGDVAISLGTSGTVYTVSDAPTADPTGAVAGFADATGRFLPLVCTLNATQVTDAFARLLGVDARRARPARAGRARRARAVSSSCRTSTASARRTDPTPPAPSPASAPTPTREQLARAAFEGVVCGLLDGLDALAQPAASRADGRHDARRRRRPICTRTGASSPTSPASTSCCPMATSTWPLGACVQAAAVLHGTDHGRVASQWGLGAGRTESPDPQVDRAAIRTRYAEVRQ